MVKIDVVINAIERNLSNVGFDSSDTYFDRLNNDFIYLFQKTFANDENVETKDSFNELENFDNNTRYVPLSIIINCHELVNEYLSTLKDQIILKHLNETLLEKSGFCKFKEALRALNMLTDYQNFRYNYYKKSSINWCKLNNIDYEE